MELHLEKIIVDLNGQPSPHELAHFKVLLAADYAFLAGQLETILMEKPEKWQELRKNYTSDTQAERAWQKTSEGLKEMSIRLRMKSCEKIISAISTRISVAEHEIRNQF